MNKSNGIDAKRIPGIRRPTPGVIAIAVVFIVVALGAGCLIGTYNGLNGARNDCDAQWSQVENVMQRRADLIPNLVSTVKGQMANEREIFSDIAKSRQAYSYAKTPNEKLEADQQLGRDVDVLVNAVHENYPELASSESVKTLMTELEGSENRISVERKRYIDDVNEYDKKPTSFPTNAVAGMLGFEKIDQFKADSTAAKAPTVDFND